MRVKILRQENPFSEPYWQEFFYEKKDDQTIAGMLNDLNYKDDIKDAAGNSVRRIQWECSCLQGMCGACAMVINDVPALACEVFLRDIKGNVLRLEPLKKFPTIADLVIDRGSILDGLRKVDAYIEEYSGAQNEEYEHMYLAGKCLKCGLCLEVCPNYKNGENFYGAAFANDCYLISARSKNKAGSIRKAYGEHFAKGCSKSLSCMEVCPMNIPTLKSMSKMNRG